MNRYRVTLLPDASAFGILDRELYDYVRLPKPDEVRPSWLTWTTRGAAEDWLLTCYQLWQQWEAAGSKKVPEGWRPHKGEKASPFDRGWQFYA
jgi:hypothetical protein